jgi:hypothetical protein
MEQESAPKLLKRTKLKKAEDMSFCIHHPAD